MAKKAKHSGTSKKSGKKINKKPLIIAALIVVGIIALGIGGGIILGNSSSIHPGMVLGDVKLGGMTENEAAAALAASGWDSRDFGSTEVKLPAGYEFTVSAKDAGLTMDCKEAAAAAYAFGHSGNPVKDLFAYFKCIAGKVGIKDVISFSGGDELEKIISTETEQLNELLSSGYIVDSEKGTLSMIKGAPKEKLDASKLAMLICEALENGQESVSVDISCTDDASCDFDAIRDEIFTEPVDAKYDAKKEEIIKSVIGIDLDIGKATKLWKEAKAGELVVIPLEVTKPEIMLENMDGKLFSDLLGTQTSNYSSSSGARANNVELAASKINGIILNPGEEFSYNDTVGKRTTEAGFKPAGAYSGGKVVNEVGGGICQVSSTLYCAALYANLEITARTDHYFAVGYLPAGLDATVSWGGPEFKFVNNRDFPIKIVAKWSNRNLTVEIWGTDVDGSYVEMNYTTAGASGGTTADTYRSVYAKDGTLISRTHEAHSFYHYHTDDEKPSESVKPTETATPSTEPTPSEAPVVTETPAPVETDTPAPENPIEIIEEFFDDRPFE